MLWWHVLVLLVFLSALWSAFNGIYSNLALVRNKLSPKAHSVWVVLSSSGDEQVYAGASHASRDLSVALKRFHNAVDLQQAMRSFFLPDLLVWVAPRLVDMPILQEMQRHLVPVVTIDSIVDGCSMVNIRGSKPLDKYRQGVWAVASAVISLGHPIFISGDSTNDPKQQEAALD